MKSSNKFWEGSTENKSFVFKKFWTGKVKEHFAPQFSEEERGFTLIELLVSLVIGTALVSVLLLFLNQILEVNRREEAKSTTQQEIQAALNFMADDLQESIYIYDSDGMEAVQAQIPYGLGASPAPDNEKQPFLLFWKRTYYAYDDESEKSGYRTYPTPGSFTNSPVRVSCITNATSCSYGTGIFTYSLVGYYLEKNNPSTPAYNTWSKSSRLARWELKEGFRDPTCTTTNCSYVNADPGYKRFDLNAPGSTLRDKMNAWKRAVPADPTNTPWAIGSTPNTIYNLTNNGPNSLKDIVDFIDDTEYVSSIDDDISNNFPISVPIRPNSSFTAIAGRFPNDDCRDVAGTGQGSQRVPGDFRSRANGGYNNSKELSSFYACVNSPAPGNPPSSTLPIARIYLRGNAAVRIADVPLDARAFYVSTPAGTSRYFGPEYTIGTTLAPTNSILVTGRGILNPNPN
jgi:prepilin-type N-terminal cleavage/methylation domain-containing protein